VFFFKFLKIANTINILNLTKKMNQFNREAFKFEKVVCDLNEDMKSQFNIGWLEDEEKMMVYIKWRWERYKHVRRLDGWFPEDVEFVLNDLQFLEAVAIQLNKINILEMIWDSIYHYDGTFKDEEDVLTYDRTIPKYYECLEEAAEAGNFQTFLHCFYAYQNYEVLNRYEPEYNELVDRSKKNPDKKISQLVTALKPIIDSNGYLPSGYSDSLKMTFPGTEKEVELFGKVKIYRQVIKNFIY
jgi:hypothetical protein